MPPAGALAGLFGRSLLYVVVGVLQVVTASVVSPVLAFQLGPQGLGLMASAIAVHQVLVIVSTAGLSQALVLQRAEDSDDSSARGLVAVGAVLACAVTVVTGVTGPLWAHALGFPGFDALVVATVLWTAPAATVQLVLALLNGQDRLRAFTAVTLLSTVLSQVVGLGLLFTLRRSVEVYAWGGVVGQVLAMAVGVVLVRPSLRGLLDLPVVRRAFALGVPLTLSGLSVFVLNAGDRLIIQRLLGSTEAGRYQVAYTIGSVALLVLTSTSTAWAPRIADIRDEGERWLLIAHSREELLRVLAPAVLGLVLGAPLLLRVLAPPSFGPATLLPVVYFVVLSAVPVVSVTASSRVLVTARRSRPMATAAAAAAAVNVVLNLLTVQRWGLVSAAAATAVAFWVQALVQRRALPPGATVRRVPLPVRAVLAVACLLGAGSVLLPQDTTWIAVRTALGVACAPWMLLALRRARRTTVV